MRRDLVIAALAAAAVAALAIPSMINSLTPSLDTDVRASLGEIHRARTLGDRAFGVSFGPDGHPIGGRIEIARPEYIIAIEADGRASVRPR